MTRDRSTHEFSPVQQLRPFQELRSADRVQAQLTNASLSEQRASALLQSNAGAQATGDAANASEKALSAQLLGASVPTSRINLDYTRTTASIDGKLGHTCITPVTVVSPFSGSLVQSSVAQASRPAMAPP